MRLPVSFLRRRIGRWLVFSALHLGLVVWVGPELTRSDTPSLVAAYLIGLMIALCWNGEGGTWRESRMKVGNFGGLTGTLDDIV